VFNCPLFKNKKIEAVETETIFHDDNVIATVAYLKLTKLEVVDKSQEEKEVHRALMEEIKKSKSRKVS
jgi:hypothetical protein